MDGADPDAPQQIVREYTLGKHSLRVRELGSSRQGFGVFPLAVAACEWLVANENVVKGRAVLELGCGCGIVGITAVKCGARAAWLTDYDHDVLENAMCNVAANHCEGEAVATVERLDWNEPQAAACEIPPVDVILASECIYSGMSVAMDLFAPCISPAREFENHSNLVSVLSTFLQRPGGEAHFFVNQDRSADALATFRAAAHQAGFTVTERRLHMSRRHECVFANEGRAGDDYVHLVVTWGA